MASSNRITSIDSSRNSFSEIIPRPTIVDIDLSALANNYRLFKQHVKPARVMAVVKANAYGHGLIPCAEHLEKVGVDSFCVAILEEGVQLRKAGITVPILVCGGILGSQIAHFIDYDLDIAASSVGMLEAVEQTAQQLGKVARVHLKIDTGMERIGVHYYSSETLYEKAIECKHCEIVGVFSHFANSDSKDLTFASTQLERFLDSLEFFNRAGAKMPMRHIANSGAALQLKSSHLDLVRVGLSLYGALGEPHLSDILPLCPVLSLKSQVVFFKVVPKGTAVSYGLTWKSDKDTRIVTLPIGYGDGYFRCLSNRGDVLVGGIRCPIVGTVCMDQIMIDVNGFDVPVGDEVVLIGKQASEEIAVEEVASLAGTIPYEILTAINQRVPRRYFETTGSANKLQSC